MFLEKKIIGLDILRFVIAIVMVTYHFQTLLENSILNELAFNSFWGTSIFFILSGFILTHVYYKNIEQHKFSITNFLIKRFFALYPIHIFTFLISLAFFFSLHIVMNKNFPLQLGVATLPGLVSDQTISVSFKDFLLYILENLTITHAWDYRFLFFNAASWSVSTLFFFYLCFFFIVKKLKKINNIKQTLIIFWFVSLIPILYLTSLQNFSNEMIGFIHRNPLLRLTDFIFGIIFYLVCLKINKYSRYLQIFALFFAISGFLLTHYLVKNDPENWFFLAHNGLFLFPQIALIYVFLNIKISNNKIKLIIEKLGKSSLTIYMLHFPLIAIYTTIYKLIIASFYSNNLKEIISIGKDISSIDASAYVFFIVILIVISYYLQERLFTPIQIKISRKLIEKKDDIISSRN